MSRLKASQFRPAWTSQAALRRKSKLSASPPPVIKTHSCCSAMVRIRPPCYHGPTLSGAVCPLGQAHRAIERRSTRRNSLPSSPGGVRHLTSCWSHQGRGSCSSRVPASLVKMARAATLYRDAADQLSNGIFLETSLNG